MNTVTKQPLAGVSLTPSWDLAPVETGADGSYELGAVAYPPTAPYKVTIAGTELLSRDVWITWQRGRREGVVLDLIRDRPPFSLEFYRQFVRGTYDEEGAPYPNLRLTQSPSFYIKTVDQNGRPIESEVLAVIREALVRGVRDFSAGVLSVVALESGAEERPPTTGWINVNIFRDPNQRSKCGDAYVGQDPGTINFWSDICACGSNKVPGHLVLHEVGHALGFFHVADRKSIMYPGYPGGCPPGQLSDAEKFHVAIAYSRPRGNRDPDIDPSNGPFAAPTIKVER